MPRSRRFFNAQNKHELLLPALFLAPALAVLLSLSIYPLIYSVTISLQQETAAGITWGLGNFTRLLSDNFFWTAMGHTFVYAAAALTCEFLLGLGLALLLNNQIRGRSLFRVSLLVPMMLSPAVVGMVWRTFMLAPEFGIVDYLAINDRDVSLDGFPASATVS